MLQSKLSVKTFGIVPCDDMPKLKPYILEYYSLIEKVDGLKDLAADVKQLAQNIKRISFERDLLDEVQAQDQILYNLSVDGLKKITSMMDAWEFNHLELKESPGLGIGVFAKQSIEKDYPLAIYEGDDLTQKIFFERYPKECEKNWSELEDTKRFKHEDKIYRDKIDRGEFDDLETPRPCRRILYPGPFTGLYLHSVSKNHFVDAESFKSSNWTRYVNSVPFTVKPNVSYQVRVEEGKKIGYLVADRFITQGEELFDDYDVGIINYEDGFYGATSFSRVVRV